MSDELPKETGGAPGTWHLAPGTDYDYERARTAPQLVTPHSSLVTQTRPNIELASIASDSETAGVNLIEHP